MAQLIEVRCPYSRVSKKNGQTYPCNRLSVKVAPGSSGEAFCTSCDKRFEFDVAKAAR
jgi:hypothetical protein